MPYTRVTQEFNITGTVPFLNVYLDTDSALFIDPNAIRISGTTLARSRNAHDLLVDFFGEILCQWS